MQVQLRTSPTNWYEWSENIIKDIKEDYGSIADEIESEELVETEIDAPPDESSKTAFHIWSLTVKSQFENQRQKQKDIPRIVGKILNSISKESELNLKAEITLCAPLIQQRDRIMEAHQKDSRR
jgi:hypothetical protein